MQPKKRMLGAALLAAGLLVCGICWWVSRPETHLIAAGTSAQTRLTVLRGGRAGATVFVIAGVHGDEVAGWKAAQRLLRVRPDAGTLYVISPANAYGAQREQRALEDRWDLNRIFPGQADGDAGQRLAYELFEAVRAAKPDILLDLHEALAPQSGRDDLGGSLIFTRLEGLEELVPGMVAASVDGALCSKPLNYFGPAPRGSINKTATELLGIPTLTVETSRVQPLEERIDDHVAVVGYVLAFYGLTAGGDAP